MSSITRIGTTVAGYRLEKLLGRGGMSVVYLAEHVRLGRMVALKLLSAALSEDESFRERFERESRRAAEIDHPNIVPIYDAGDADGQFFIAMRYVQGSDLKAQIKRDGPLNVGRTLYLLEQAASALDAAHERDLVHRDVKPANILIDEPSDHVFLTDFGVVKHTASHGLTRTGFFIGTVDYAAPEQIEGLPVDARTDVYALGCVLYECLAGRVPFDRDAEVAAMHAHLTEPPPSLRSVRPDLPRELDRVIASAMAKAKDERQASCEELIQAAHAAALGRRTSTAQHVPAPGVAGVTAGLPEGVEPEVPAPGEPEGPEQAEPVLAEPVAAHTNPGAAAPEAEPPAPEAGNGAGRRSRIPGWLLAAIVAVVAAAATGVAVYFVAGSNSSTPAATGTGGSTTGDHQMGQNQGDLLAMLPADLPTTSCKEAASDHPGGLMKLDCDYTTKPGRRILLHVDTFRNKDFLYASYQDHGVSEVKVAGGAPDPNLQTDTGECSGTAWLGEGSWSHEAGGAPAGRRLCFIAKGSSKICQPTGAPACSVIVWTSDLSNLFMRAAIPSTVHRELFTWWRFHAHLFG
jgi:serine/threonine-protein kinase